MTHGRAGERAADVGPADWHIWGKGSQQDTEQFVVPGGTTDDEHLGQC